MSTPASPTSGGLAAADPADAGAGEVVYSSDGLAPIEVTKPTTSSGSSSDENVVKGDAGNNDKLVLDSEQMPAESAFEVFQGKIYSNGGGGGSCRREVQQHADDDDEAAKEYDEMPPLEKLALLQHQVSRLEAELKTTAADSGRDFDEQVVQLAGDLKTRLMTASSSQTSDQDELSRMIRQQLENVQKAGSKTESGSSASAPSSSSTPGGTTGLVYELYGTSSSNPTTSTEERILKLERMLGNSQKDSATGSSTSNAGSSGGSTGGPKSLLQRLEEMEVLVATVDTAVIDQTATKAKVIRADLEAASKARSKLSAAYKKEDTKMIQDLYQQMVDLEGVSDYLPSLVERLSQLSGLHRQAATFGGRLDELEMTTQQIESTVSQIEGGMANLQSAMVGNLQTLEQNMSKLDEKLTSI
eukprot:CAMPEP_0113452834 /NCGR_PEP_ID=MMETSP0014_2-20120614/7049_1 /TAXON_ID=2857 /ORGANISM="Nitzschia sp." /LENGTH=414 /DNA_ID=CAMNT_0000344215 /DNA_START=106 /DNA_END=1350 /DNA_ORIENTATION=+ /assembly_acc=CAM_ASM_000159